MFKNGFYIMILLCLKLEFMEIVILFDFMVIVMTEGVDFIYLL